MKSSKLLPLAVLSTAALLFHACGAKQGGKHRLAPSWDTAIATIPADAAYGSAIDYAQFDDTRVQNSLAAFDRLPELFLGQKIADLATIMGIDERGDSAIFIRNDALWMVAKVKDPAASLRAMQEVISENGTLEERRIGHRPILRGLFGGDVYTHEGRVAFDSAVLERYIVVRIGAERPTEFVDAELLQMAAGWPGVGTLVSTDASKTVLARVHGAPVAAFSSLSTKGINATFTSLKESDSTLLNALGMYVPYLTGSGNADPERCDELNRRIETVFPSLTSVGTVSADGQYESIAVAPLSGRPLERARAILKGGPDLKGVMAHAIFGVGISFDYGTFLGGLQATPEHEGCLGLAGAAGALAGINDAMGTRVRFNTRTVSGTFGLVLESIDLNGLVPTAAGALAIHSPNPTALMDRVLRALQPMGTATVDTRASSPSVNVQLNGAPVNVRVQAGEDRVVLNVGRLSEATAAGMRDVELTPANGASTSVLSNGQKLAALANDVENYLVEMELMTPALREQVTPVLTSMRGNRSLVMEMRVTANGLEMTSRY